MGTLYGRAPSRPRLLSRLGWRSKVAALVAIPALALAPQAATLVTSGSASAATAPPELPVAVTNNSGTADATYVYIIGHNTSTNQDGYIDGSGTFHAWSYPSSIPAGQPNPATPDFSIAGPGNGASEDIYLPQNIAGGRIYMSFGAKLQFFLTTNGLVQPAPWASGDPNQNTLFDWVEFTRSATGLDINTTMVDMFSVPFALSVTDTNGTTQSEGQLVSNGRANIFSQIAALGGSWPNLIYNDPTTGQPLRVIAPLHGIEASSFPSTFLDSYVSAVWSYYQSHTLTVSTGAATYTGTVSGSSFNFVDSTGAAIGSIAQPTTSQVFGCSGPLQPGGQPNETAILAVGAVVCAALNRGTLSTSSFAGSDTQPTSNASSFYTIATSNLYAKVMHQNSVDGKAYGFAFDDVAGFSTNINDGSTQSASITVSPFTGSTTTTTTAPSATTTTAPATTTTVAPQGYNNTGISADSNPGGANFDGGGWSYSATALANAGTSPGSTVASDGFNFTWPNVAAGSPDNWQAAGQTVSVGLPAGSSQLGILGAAGSASSSGSSGTATVNYSDGTSSTFTLLMPDWALGGGGDALPSGYTEAITSAYRNSSGGSQTLTMYVFATSVPINSAKTVTSVTLPSSVSSGNLHVFAFAGNGTGSTASCSGEGSAGADISADCFAASSGSPTVTATSDPSPSGVDANQVSQIANGVQL
ncbi:MAG TPA: beta-1,3-glucanase family protein, partial [Acidimicrobiales bacterium]|nr:beta-1,3-glucanase family protein [Acidimicrobiales bacterium]